MERKYIYNRDGASLWFEQVDKNEYILNVDEKHKYVLEYVSMNYEIVPDDSTVFDFNRNGKKGLYKSEDGNWYYYENGVVNADKNGIVVNDAGYWYVENGKINFNKNGVVEDNGVEYLYAIITYKVIRYNSTFTSQFKLGEVQS